MIEFGYIAGVVTCDSCGRIYESFSVDRCKDGRFEYADLLDKITSDLSSIEPPDHLLCKSAGWQLDAGTAVCCFCSLEIMEAMHNHTQAEERSFDKNRSV